MRDTRHIRAVLIVGLSASIGAVLGEFFIRPTIEKAVKK